MPKMHILSAVEQVAAKLREEMLRGTWMDHLPGIDALSEELGVSRKTVDAALRLLEGEGWLVAQGRRKRRRIELQEDPKPPPLRVVMLADQGDERWPRYMLEAQHELAEAGHIATFAQGGMAMAELGMDPKRIVRIVRKTEADAWIVMAGTQVVLEWFRELGKPTLAVFGRRQGLGLASVGPDKSGAFAAAARTLLLKGHRRIVLIARPLRRLPEPGKPEMAFLDELAAHGVPSGSYNLPDWEEGIDGLHARLDSLFRVTPPTALIIDEAPLFFSVQQFLTQRKLLVPQDVSLVCTDPDSAFSWAKPSVAHIQWDNRQVVARILQWAANISRGRKDTRTTDIPSRFVPGGTIGPAKG